MSDHILLTGGAGYIGSHTFVALAAAGYTPVILDNFSNAQHAVINRLENLTGSPVICHQGDVLDLGALADLFARYPIRAAVHFAAKKAVQESVEDPLEYYRTNVGGLVSLLQAMQAANVRTLVFSSSATVYGDPDFSPIPESAALRPANPYGHTKLMCEQILADAAASDPAWAFGVLRYFNPVGAHPSGVIGEDSADRPNNLMPYIERVAAGILPELQVFGDDYDTPDGTGVRDYIHVSDLAEGHVLSLTELLQSRTGHMVNLGTGRGQSVFEVIEAYRQASGQPIPYRVVDRRPGDVPSYYADPSKAEALLGFRATRALPEMCATSWNWIRGQ